jgi:hypothetical protein
MKDLLPFLMTVLIVFSLTACSSSGPSSSSSTSLNEAAANPAPRHHASDPEGEFTTGNQHYLSQTHLVVSHNAPTSGAAKAAWDFFDYSGQQQYDKALTVIDQDNLIYSGLTGATGTPYLKEIIAASFIRWADVTSIISKETEDNDSYSYKIIYLEMNLQLRGQLTKQQTGLRQGTNCFAVHVVQKHKDGPWTITLLAGTPWMTK